MSPSRLFLPSLAAALLACSPAHAQAPAERTPVGGPASGWAVESADRSGDARLEPFLGRADALWLKAGAHVVRTGVELADGTIEFDLAPMDRGDFTAVTFRRDGFRNHENLYLRLRRSGEFMALQYAPRMNGSSTWQLYREFVTAVDWPRNQWTHVRIEIRGSRLEVYVGDRAEPALVVPRLRHAADKGEIAFWGRVNNRPELWASAISNVQIRSASAARPDRAPAPPAGLVAKWEVGTPIAAPADRAALPPPGLDWKPIEVEESGLVNLNRRFRATPGRSSTAYARATLRAQAAGRVALGLGYSDDVAVFLNGEPLFFGRNGLNARYPGSTTFVDADHETVVLPLRAGDNELVLAVTDDQLFGWGFSARLDPAAGVEVR